ncbi:hypothetical protein J5500_04580 [Candidatus Saccharibacteria bacterium]|nr:hypothetical protein [Candidatus Saccharibacteria bacterium]
MVYQSKYGGELLRIPLRSLLKVGRGDDVFVVVDNENHSRYGVLSIDRNIFDYELAQRLAAEQHTGEPIMVAVEDPESGSPMMLAREVWRDGKRHFLAVIFNAKFANDPEENRNGSFCLRLSGALDPDSKVSERIIYSPGEHIEWNEEQVGDIVALLDA